MPSPQDIKTFLEQHPDFLVEHPDLLETLQVPHGLDGPAVSLVERQVQVLRDRQAESRQRLAELVRNARDNEALVGRVHALALQPTEEAAYRRQPALHAARREPAGVRARREHPQMLAVERRPAVDALRVAPAGERLHLAQVVGDGVRRHAPLAAEVRAEAPDGGEGGGGHG